jgi:hypothetical protein
MGTVILAAQDLDDSRGKWQAQTVANVIERLAS